MRQLSDAEIAILEQRGSRAEDWSQVRVADGFTPGNSFYRVYFSGRVELGACRGALRTSDGFAFPAGIDHSSLHDVKIGNDCLILRSNLSNADIGDNVILENVGALSRSGDAPFANNSPVHVLAEDGARSVPLWRRLSAQLAHLLCHLKNHPAADALAELIRRDSERLRLPRSRIADGCRLRRVGALRNVWLGEGALVDHASSLVDCYLDSAPEAPVRIGEGVAVRDCVFQRGCEVTGGVRLEHCLVGEGVRLAGGFNGKHSLFFANSEFALGEAACAMAGPFAVSSHKATLILTSQNSFSTFGSAANSSNHHFKLGPLHGGVLRRGVKCGSGSYIFWPSDIGAFSTVVGKHSGHLETIIFPFSLLVGKDDKSILVPGVNLFACGTYRDGLKWRDRDRRGGIARPLDLVNTAVLSPYVLQFMEAGLELLRRSASIGVDLRHGGAVIPFGRIKPAVKLYKNAIIFHSGERLLAHARQQCGLERPGPEDLLETLTAILREDVGPVSGKWRDWGGMLLPGGEAEKVLAELADGSLSTPEMVQERLASLHERYEEFVRRWLALRWRREYGDPTAASVAAFVGQWRKAVQFRHECFVRDVHKEFTPEAMYGFGVEDDAETEFRRVRGFLVDHPLLAMAEAERERLLALAERLPRSERL